MRVALGGSVSQSQKKALILDEEGKDLVDDGEAASESYGAESIKVLRGLDAVRKRPGMYIGDTDDGSGLHHMVYEVVDNAIDEALAGYAKLVTVTLNADGSCTVRDDGRGIPTGIHEGEGVSAAEVIMTQLHAGGKFDQNSYKVSGGLHGVGVSVVNALSSRLVLRDLARRLEHFIEFADGDAVAPLKVVGPAPIVDGRRSAAPRSRSCPRRNLHHGRVRLRDASSIACASSPSSIPASRIVLDRHAPRRVEKREELHYEGGVEAFVKYLDRDKTAAGRRSRSSSRASATASASKSRCGGTTATTRTCCCFTNNIPQRDGGTHLAGFRGALTRQVTGYAESSGLPRRRRSTLTGDDCREGLTCVLSRQSAPIRNSPRRPRTSSSPRKCGRWSRASSTTCSGALVRGASAARPRSSSARWSRRPRRARRRARRAR